MAAWRKITSAASLSLTMSRCSTIRSSDIEETLATMAPIPRLRPLGCRNLIPCLDNAAAKVAAASLAGSR